jgi:predicted nucleic acid-binding protein
LLIATRKGRITAPDRAAFVSLLQSLPIHVDVVPAALILTSTLSLAESHRLTAYDASYLELAIRLTSVAYSAPT